MDRVDPVENPWSTSGSNLRPIKTRVLSPPEFSLFSTVFGRSLRIPDKILLGSMTGLPWSSNHAWILMVKSFRGMIPLGSSSVCRSSHRARGSVGSLNSVQACRAVSESIKRPRFFNSGRTLKTLFRSPLNASGLESWASRKSGSRREGSESENSLSNGRTVHRLKNAGLASRHVG